jgi:hypothetical protein
MTFAPDGKRRFVHAREIGGPISRSFGLVPYGPPTIIHMESLQRKTIGPECIVARLPGDSG